MVAFILVCKSRGPGKSALGGGQIYIAIFKPRVMAFLAGYLDFLLKFIFSTLLSFFFNVGGFSPL